MRMDVLSAADMADARTLHMRDCMTGRVTDYYTGRGTHDGCGECCSRFLPVSDGELAHLKEVVSERGIKPRLERADVDLTCPLLDEDNRCSVYDDRPLMCRVFSCADHARGQFRIPVELVPEMALRDLRYELWGKAGEEGSGLDGSG